MTPAKAQEKRSDVTKKRILDAAAAEFVEKGYEAVSISQIAKRAGISKQLVHHHFPSKRKLFETVHEYRYRPPANWDDEIPADLDDIIAERFLRRSKNADYMRVLTWEAATTREGKVPGERERRLRIRQYGDKLRSLQAEGRIPGDVDAAFLQLLVLALASYPISFTQVTRLVTGRPGTDPKFQQEWAAFLRKITRKLLT
jgi:TetR/AcrR family transcriptional regulator